jgi:hypothetical protein
MKYGGGCLLMANIVQLTSRRYAWVWASLTGCVPFTAVFSLGPDLRLWTEGKDSKSVRVGNKASRRPYHSVTFTSLTSGEQARRKEIGELLRP